MSDNNNYYDFEQVKQAAKNNWGSILSALGGASSELLNKKHSACPVCHGNDRFRFDDKNGEGTWFCSHGSSHGQSTKNSGDGFMLLRDLLDQDFKSTLNTLAKYLGISPSEKKSKEKEVFNVTDGPRVGVWQEYYSVKNSKVKKFCPKYVWYWCKDREGYDWYIARCEWEQEKTDKDGTVKKERVKIPYQIRVNPELNRFEQGSFKGLRPIVGKISTNKVLIVEGAKTMDAAKKLLEGLENEWSVITWEGGIDQTHLTDWTILHGKEVLIFPDNDPQGLKAMRNIQAKARAFASSIEWVKPPENVEAGWDLADALEFDKWDQNCLIEYMEAYTREFEGFEEAVDILKEIKALGYDESHYYFLSLRERRIVSLTTSELSQKYYWRLQSQDYWDNFCFNEKGKEDWSKINRALVDACYAEGAFMPSLARGHGCWIDGGQTVINFGEELLVDGKPVPILDYNSKYFYEHRGSRDLCLDDPLEHGPLEILKEVIDNYAWEQKVFSDLFFGAVVLAPLCGCLRWRPHIWLTGSAGAGKSTILESILIRLLEGFCLAVEGETTEAGIRQGIKSDAIPIIFEEAEGDNHNAKRIMERNISLARKASSRGNTKTLKGTTSNQAIEYKIRSMFFFASVAVSLKHKPDIDRVAVLSLDPVRKQSNYELTKELLSGLDSIKNLSGKFIRTCYDNVAAISYNAELFSDLLHEKYNSKRFGDQYGFLLAGRAILDFPERKLDKETAREWINKFDLSCFKQVVEETQERDILDLILQYDLRIEFVDKTYTQTIGQLIETYVVKANKPDTSGVLDIINRKLLSIGIKIDDDCKTVYFATKSVVLEKAVGSINASSWAKLVERIPGAERPNSGIHFGEGFGRKRAIQISTEELLQIDLKILQSNLTAPLDEADPEDEQAELFDDKDKGSPF